MTELTNRAMFSIQVTTSVAVIAGLGLVVWQLQQVRDVTMAQLTSDGYDQGTQILIAQMGEAPSIPLEKACNNPESLSDADILVLNAFFSARLLQVLRPYNIEKRTGMYTNAWQDIAPGTFFWIFSSSPGRDWWEQRRTTVQVEVREFGDRVLEQGSNSLCRNLGRVLETPVP